MSHNESWSDLVGMLGDEAVQTIQNEYPGLEVILLPEGSPTTRYIRENRVHVFFDYNNLVSSEPRVG
ncbi:unnamed protein product [Rotaria sp. Silwood1]|nr:unnamed protein product [Rotaria sp. Silwood1]CAF3434105.1 unnamed protein product [Rotaria sp. Silwood1]CAF3473222.1 unnamed protein product [Rotaria sp. Silwood1]CAF4722250.1 unnamed protein product [Rotaria sp. Silwood1]CAF4733064.1 unnamed protein product [Rotaria sp. Silwood1]